MSASTFYKNIIFFTSGHALRCKIKPELFNHVCLWSEKKVINYIILLLKDSSIYSVNTSLDFTFQDYPGKAFRFVATYFLLSYTYNSRFLFFTMNKDNYPMITNSLIHSSMNWAEREAWDMFGCYFEGNDFMVRILNDYGFKGFPLRKDFPMTGFLEYWYSFDSKGVVKYPVKLMQEYRKFKLSFIWSADSRKEIMSFM